VIRLNIIGRISDDKNSFFDILFALYKLKAAGYDQIKLLLIGGIFSESVYRTACKMITLYGLDEQVAFTRQSIRPIDLEQDIKDSYFCNFTVGDFMGYSGIECINMGFKTIFYNGDTSVAEKMPVYYSMCRDLDAFIELMKDIDKNRAVTDAKIIADNIVLKQNFILQQAEETLLLNMLLPANA
jgi:hypothetical protein